jgi:hypothetical protein
MQVDDRKTLRQVSISNLEQENTTNIVKSYAQRKTGFILLSDARALLDSMYEPVYVVQMKRFKEIYNEEFQSGHNGRHLLLHLSSYKPKIVVKGDLDESTFSYSS